jgi:hypothetical protein
MLAAGDSGRFAPLGPNQGYYGTICSEVIIKSTQYLVTTHNYI